MGWAWKIGDWVEFELFGSREVRRWMPAKVIDNDIRDHAGMVVVAYSVGGARAYDVLEATQLYPRGFHDRVEIDYAKHSIPVSLLQERCHACRKPATHKVGDQSGPANYHELTNWLCCSCMRTVGLHCDLYPAH